jgi:steroid 5-alpha reductase family enzyme
VSFDGSAFAGSLAWSAGALVVLLTLTYIASRIAGRHSVIDATWGLLFVTVAVVSFIASAGYGDDLRRWLLLAMTAVWGLRLAGHIARRAHGKGEDPRYDALLDKAKGNRELYAFVMIYLLQGALAFVIAAPLMVGSYEPAPVRPLAWIGVGLWRYTRHPNYFGDACVWWGLFLVAADALPGVVTVFAPVIMTLLLTVGSGVRILEKGMSRRAGWADYAARTSMFVPLPPRKTARAVSSAPSGQP